MSRGGSGLDIWMTSNNCESTHRQRKQGFPLSQDVSLSGWKFGAGVHSLPELRQENGLC